MKFRSNLLQVMESRQIQHNIFCVFGQVYANRVILLMKGNVFAKQYKERKV